MLNFISNSSFISKVTYDEMSGRMVVYMRNGMVYPYMHIPYSVFNGFMYASSHGKYFNTFIKGRY